jgi:hypothetical protein
MSTRPAERKGGIVTRYLLLIHTDEPAWEALSPEERQPTYELYSALAREMEERGHVRGGDELAPGATAKVVRVRHGERIVVDGPFAETKEQLGGYFLVDCDLEAALDYAARIPAAGYGAVEVRQVVEGPS